MSSCTLQLYSLSPTLFRTGSGAGKVKPSTGYAFKEMARDAIHIVDTIHTQSFKHRVVLRSGKFSFYDRLLLKILEQHPSRGKEIFERLFQHVDGKRVLQFLEEKTSIIEDISIFMALPKTLFMKYAVKDMLSGIAQYAFGFIPLMVSLFFLLCKQYELELINWSILAIGMILIGIPHGAMDHVLTIGERTGKSLALFILGYMAKGIFMLAIWIMSPLLGLIIFLLYSMWHFGQAEYEQENIHNPWLLFLRGFAVLSFILATHIPETNVIINALSIPSIPDTAGLLTSSLLSESSILLLLMTVFIQPRKSTILSTASLLIGIFLPLLQAFGVYFVFHHSFLGWNHLKKGLQKTDLQLWEISAPFSITAIGTIFLFFINTGYTLTGFTPLFFVLLSCLSFPHVLEMHTFYGSIFKRS
jgi:Brp/Blh family beta-carotene 15,15'-monooxygenase